MEKPPHPIFDRRIENIERKTKSPAVLHQLLLAGLVVQRGHWSSPRTGRSIRGREPQAKRDCSTAKAGGRSGGRVARLADRVGIGGSAVPHPIPAWACVPGW